MRLINPCGSGFISLYYFSIPAFPAFSISRIVSSYCNCLWDPRHLAAPQGYPHLPGLSFVDNTPGWFSHSQLWDTVTDNGMAWKCKSDTGWTKHDVFMQWHDLIYCYWMNKYSDNGDKAFGFVTNDSHNIELLTGSSQWTDELQYASANWRKGHEYWSLSSTSTATATFSDFTGAWSTHSSCIRMMLKTVVLIQLWTSFL